MRVRKEEERGKGEKLKQEEKEEEEEKGQECGPSDNLKTTMAAGEDGVIIRRSFFSIQDLPTATSIFPPTPSHHKCQKFQILPAPPSPQKKSVSYWWRRERGRATK